jgi:hypothetical protein
MRLCPICHRKWHKKLPKGQYCVPSEQLKTSEYKRPERKDPMTLAAIKESISEIEKANKKR